MKVYFLSSMPCALSINETFFGTTDDFERFANLALRDNLFIRFAPENALPITFFLTEQIRFSAPKGCEVYLLRDSIAIYARDFPPSDFTLRPVAQKRVDDCLVSVFRQGEVQLSVQNATNYYTAPLSPDFAECEMQMHQNLIFLKSPKRLAIFTRQAERVFYETVQAFEINGDTFTALLPLYDSLGRKAECTYTIENETLSRQGVTLIQERFFTQDKRAELLPYAFFESVLLGVDYTEFLSDELLEKANALREFLGEYTSVVITESPFVCGLVRKKGERIYEVDYYTVQVLDGKIVDITG